MGADSARESFLRSVARAPVNWSNIRTAIVDPLLESFKALRTEQRTKATDHDERIALLEDRLRAIEAKCTPDYQGLYDPTIAYTRGSCTTFDGSLWIARSDIAKGQPPPGHGWTLCVKKGRDARDRR